jgi:hypothetical protein
LDRAATRGRITKVTLPDGRFVQYSYVVGRLTRGNQPLLATPQ